MATHDLIPQSPLMHPVVYQEQTYFTSQYFHTQYLANSPGGGKYRRHDSFMRLVRGIEAYAEYLSKGDIVELAWGTVKTYQPQLCGSFQPLFRAAGWNSLTLMNATAQLALSNLLDDKISKQIAVAANTTIARQQTARALASSTPVELASREMAAWLQIGALLGTPLHITQQEAAKQIEVSTGVNLRPLLLSAPAQNSITPDEEMLEPTELAQRLGLPSAAAVNLALEKMGWQVKRIGGGWDATPTGLPYASRHACAFS